MMRRSSATSRRSCSTRFRPARPTSISSRSRGSIGSGKTVSLYSMLQILNQPGVNISTAEDPAEISLPGVNQVNVNDKAGMTFAIALRAFLRQDPDIIMVGEIRDLETADIAVKAA